MLTFRRFRNPDPPTIAGLWRSRAGQPGLRQPISTDLLEQLVFAKLYFDYAGLIIASDDGRPVGFAHAGFGPNADQSWISPDVGVTCLVLVRPDCAAAEAAVGLLRRCEEYLRGRGAKTLYAGGLYPLSPFYLGLYGESEPPGVLSSDTVAHDALVACGYREVERTTLLRRELSGFESTVDRRQMQVRRQMIVEVTTDAPTLTWWEASILGNFDLTRFELVPRVGGPAVATATFRGMEPIGAASPGGTTGLIQLRVEEPYRRRGLALFLLSEAFRQSLRQGITHVEALARHSDAAALEMFQKLGFQVVEEGGVWRKD
jgi:ribosomal protein S18 acetylase RimI-like enzyme